ncbi:aldo/keto reductase [Ferviditalea candida]
MKLGLGTVQFGLDYGVSNKKGKTPPEEAYDILEAAHRLGIRVLDTAALYGSSEETLGHCLLPHHNFSIITKTPQFSSPTLAPFDAKLLVDTFHQSLTRMRQKSIYGLLIHQADDLLKDNGHLLAETMVRLKQSGFVEKIGVSVYTGAQIDRILELYPVDIIQLPLNILDQRLLLSGHLSKLKKSGIEIHARSVFLQGLLLMNPAHLPEYFSPVKKHLEHFQLSMRRIGISPKQAALQFVMGIKEIDTVLCGVNNRAQLLELSNLARLPSEPLVPERFSISDDTILNPSKWRIDTHS